MATANYVPGQILTAAELNASLNAKADTANAQLTGGYFEGADHVYIDGTDISTSTTTGALTVAGGVGIGGDVNTGGKLTTVSDITSGGNLAAKNGTFSGPITSQLKVLAINAANLLANSSGEFGNIGWSSSVFASTPGALGQGSVFTNPAAVTVASQDGSTINVGAGVTLAVSAEVSAVNVAAGRCYVSLEAFSAANASLGVIALATLTNGSGFKLIQASGTTPANTSYVKVWKGVDTSPNVPAGALVFRRIKLEVGTAASLYSQEASFSALTSNSNGELPIATTGGTTTLTPDQFTNGILKITGALTANAVIVVPATSHSFVVQNLTTGLFTVTIQAAGQTPTASIVQGKAATLFSDSTGVYATSSAAGLSFAGLVPFAGSTTLGITQMGSVVTQSAASVTTFPKANTVQAGTGFGFANIDSTASDVVQLALQAGDTADLTMPFNCAPNDLYFWYSDGVSKWKLGWYSNKFNPVFSGVLSAGGVKLTSGSVTFADGSVQTTATAGTAPTSTIFSVANGNVVTGATTLVVPAGFSPPFVTLYRNGVKLTGTQFSLGGDNKTITIVTPFGALDEIEVLTGFTYNPSTVYVPSITPVTPAAGATGIAISYPVGFVDVFENGALLTPGTDYTATDGANITFVGFTADGTTQYQVRIVTPITYANTVSQSNPVLAAPLTFADGTVQGTGAVGFKNWMLNPQFDVWQAGTGPFANPTSVTAAYTADGWQSFRNSYTSGISTSIAQLTSIPGFYYQLQQTRAVGDTNTNIFALCSSFETVDVRKFAGKQMTFSIYVAAGGGFVGQPFNMVPVFGTGVDGNLAAGLTNQASISASTYTLTNGFVRRSVTFTVPANATQFGIQLVATPGAAAAVSGETVTYAGSQLEFGPIASQYEYHPFDHTVRRCQRHFQPLFNTMCSGYQASGGAVYNDFSFPVPMRTTPTITFGGAVNYSNASGQTFAALGAGAYRVTMTVTSAGYGLGYGGTLQFNARL